MVSFWSTALGQAAVAHEWGDYHLDPPPRGPRERTIWINNVPEAPAGKSRAHLDLRLPDGDPAPLVAAGARIVRPPTDTDRWYVLEDPDGIPLCVMGPHPGTRRRRWAPSSWSSTPPIPRAIARWWAERTGGTFGQQPGTTVAWVEGAAGFPYAYWVFTQVPEPKTAKNRVHWDVKMLDADVELLQERGRDPPPTEGRRDRLVGHGRPRGQRVLRVPLTSAVRATHPRLAVTDALAASCTPCGYESPRELVSHPRRRMARRSRRATAAVRPRWAHEAALHQLARGRGLRRSPELPRRRHRRGPMQRAGRRLLGRGRPRREGARRRLAGRGHPWRRAPDHRRRLRRRL